MAKDQEQDIEVQEAQETQPELKPKHVGFGRYEVDGQRFESKDDAYAYIEAKRVEAEDEEQFGDVIPEGYDMSILDRPYIYRGSMMELPMNERYAPDGSFNKYYDREWHWGWGAFVGTDISDKQAKGYKTVDIETLEKLVKDDKVPSHVLSMVRAEGTMLVYGDSILMRMPRVIRRQRMRENFERNMRRMKALDQKQRQAFEEAGVGLSEREEAGKNELDIRF